MNFKIKIIGEISSNSGNDSGNVDVEIEFENGEKYIATFFTLKNIEKIFNRYSETGECAWGTYFWASDMIIVKELNTSTINKTIRQLLVDDEFKSVCKKI